MRTRNGYRYVIKVFEAQWDQHHAESVKPFFEQLKRDTEETYARRNGYRHDRPGHDALFSDVGLFDMGIELRWIRGFGDRYRVLWRGEVGALFSSDFSSLPPSLRYFAGGDRSVRGYAYEALGPVDEFGDVIGGTKLLVTAIELDAAVRRSWRVALFADVGNALDSFEDPYEAGAGVGIRWRSPVGMVRLDGAFAVTRRGWPFRLHLNLGPEL